MPRRCLLLALSLALGALLLVPSAAGVADGTPPVITLDITGTLGSNGWYTSNVTVSWTVSDPESGISDTDGCNVATLTSDTAGSPQFCSATNNADVPLTSSTSVTIKIDETAPEATGANPDRPPDRNGWYNHPVSIAFSGSDSMSGIDSCTSGTYGGPDTQGASATGTCRDKAGNTSAQRSFAVKYDATPPSATGATAERPPDSGDWYTRAVTFAFAGADGTSGVESCTSAAYSGPDTDSASVTGTCMDGAGNTSSPASQAFKYDGTAPAFATVTAEPGDGAATLRWKPAPDMTSVAIVRSPGRKGARATTIYQGKGTRFEDRRLKNGVRYRYQIIGYDVARNSDTEALVVVPKAPLHTPKQGARLAAPPLLLWVPVGKATFYNVQLFRGTEKILSLWPARNRLRLRATWVYEGTRYSLSAGRYRWYVWPGFGKKAQRRFGARLGGSSFVVIR